MTSAANVIDRAKQLAEWGLARDKERAALLPEIKKRKAEEARKLKEKKREVNRTAFKALLDLDIGLTDDQAKGLIVSIAKGKIPAIFINYK